jgi:hypothetical protein
VNPFSKISWPAARPTLARWRGPLGAAAAVSAATFGIQVSAGADGLQHNIAGNSHNHGDPIAIAPIRNELGPAQIPALSVNEICYTQVAALTNFFASKGYPYLPAAFVQATNVPGCGSYGLNAYAAGSGISLSNPSNAYVAQYGEVRGWACVAGGVNTPKFLACSTHLKPDYPGEPSKKNAQFKEYIGVLDYFRSGGWKVTAGGDMYLTWSQMTAIPGLSGLFSIYGESGRCVAPLNEAWTLSDSSGTRKVDHVLFDGSLACTANGSTLPAVAPGSIPNGLWPSDHRLVHSKNSNF